jgi:hypothetical protein
MTINLRSSFSLPGLFSACALLLVLFVTSCQTHQEDGVWIPVPKDTSALGRIDHFIPIEQIGAYKKLFDVERDTLSVLAPRIYLPQSEAFNKPALLEVLKDPRCVGIRIYYGAKGLDGASSFRLMIVGVDEQGKDLYIKKGSAVATQVDPGGDGGLEYGQCAPPCYP